MQRLLSFLQPRIDSHTEPHDGAPLAVAGLFAGIGGIESGLHASGHTSSLLCEIEPAAQEVLKTHFPRVTLHDDVTTLDRLPVDTDMLAAGFPCQDLSISGRRQGITGSRSSLVSHVFRLLDKSRDQLRWLLLENVPFMLKLDSGGGMRYLIDELEARGLYWAYRVVDTRSFGLPHRRHRVVVLASSRHAPWDVLLSSDSGREPSVTGPDARLHGFYWTEGNRGIGWSIETCPPLKVGSGLGIASSPATWDAESGEIRKIDIRDAERLQGFPVDWTKPAERVEKPAARWKLVGNAVSVPLGTWLGSQLRNPQRYDWSSDHALTREDSWPDAAYGGQGEAYRSTVSAWPMSQPLTPLREFLQFPGDPLSTRAAAGLLYRIQKGTTKISNEFERALLDMSKQEELRLKKKALEDLIVRIESCTRMARAASQFAEQVRLNEEVQSLRFEAKTVQNEIEELAHADTV